MGCPIDRQGNIIKVGDRVAILDEGSGSYWSGIKGTVNRLDDYIIIVIPDKGSTYSDGSPILESYQKNGFGWLSKNTRIQRAEDPTKEDYAKLKEFGLF